MRQHVDALSVIVCIFFLNFLPSQSNPFAEFCTSFLPKDYKIYESPNKDGPVKIYVKFNVLDIGEINEESMDYLFHTFFNMVWKDSRIKINVSHVAGKEIPQFLPRECFDYFWKPIVFFENAKFIEAFQSSAPAVVLKVYSGGIISVYTRYLFRCSCRMEFQDYPFDRQTCEFKINPTASTREFILNWFDEKDNPMKGQADFAAIHLLRDIQPLQYSFGGVKKYKTMDILPDANYTVLVAVMLFERRIITSIINTYIPSTLIVFMSCLGFWFGVEAVPARVALCVTSLLTLCTQVQQYQSQLPPVNYVKAMDIWLFVCIFFVFSTLVEFSVAHNVAGNLKIKNENVKDRISVQPNNPTSKCHRILRGNDSNHLLFRKIENSNTEKKNHNEETQKIIKFKMLWAKCTNRSVDEWSQILYPIAFISFAIFYWTFYLKRYFKYS